MHGNLQTWRNNSHKSCEKFCSRIEINVPFYARQRGIQPLFCKIQNFSLKNADIFSNILMA